jgi:hypothetical protein
MVFLAVDSLYRTIEGPEAEPSRCAYVSGSGSPCSRPPVEGEAYCIRHGANLVRAQDVIARRLLALQEKAIFELADLLTFAFDDRVKLAAIQTVLDRTGFGPKSTVAVEQPADDLTSLSEAQVSERVARLHQRLAVLRQQLQDDPRADSTTTH